MSGKYAPAELGKTYKALRNIQLYITVLNTANQDLIFTWKLESIGMCITSGYAAIAHFNDYPIFGVMYWSILLNCSVNYTLVYGKAFRVPNLIQDIKKRIRLSAGVRCCGPERKMLFMQANSIPSSLGIKVGQFHTLERVSTPVYLHYIVTNIVSMLVAWA